MQPWERRLGDLAHALKNCGKTYFAPELFRRNTNHFLQTSRTVTFIIQKHKDRIPDFDRWYKQCVVMPWASDAIMTWAKDARNTVEKEGDLEMHSSLNAKVIFSYDAAHDVLLDTSKAELLKAGLERLLARAASGLPPLQREGACLQVQRRWVANSLPTYELIHAMTYVYGRLYDACNALAVHTGETPDRTIPHPTDLDPTSNDVGRSRFLKLGEDHFNRQVQQRILAAPAFRPPAALVKLKQELASEGPPSSLTEVVSARARLAEYTFSEYGNHIPMLALFDSAWTQIDGLSTVFRDKADKFMFWRHVADRAAYLRAYAMVWTCESWMRDMRHHGTQPASELPISGERLSVLGADADGGRVVFAWEISRPDPKAKPVLGDRFEVSEGDEFFFPLPVIRAMRLVRGMDPEAAWSQERRP